MVTWILEQNVFSEKCFDEMVNHFKRNDTPYHLITVIPFSHEIDGKVPIVNGNCVVYGSIGIQKLALQYNWKPGVWTNDLFNETKLIKSLGDSYLNHDAVLMNMTEVSDYIQKNRYRQFFIKPNTDTKEFAGTIIIDAEFNQWYKNMIDIGYLDNNDFEVIVCSPKNLGMEWRLVIIDGKVCECSIYKQYRIVKPERQMNKQVIKFAEQCASVHSPVPVFVMDIVESLDGLKVIEYNTFNSAGLYDCDVGNIIDSINNYITNGDSYEE